MALIQCPGCGEEISENAASCPKCGEPIKKEKTGRSFNWLKLVGFIIVLYGMFTGIASHSSHDLNVAAVIGFIGFLVFIAGRFKD